MVNTVLQSEQTQEYNEETQSLESFLFVDGIIGEKQKEYIATSFEVKKITEAINDLQSAKSDLLLLKKIQLEINTEATHEFHNKSTRKTRQIRNESNNNLTETELKISKIDAQITDLETALFLVKEELQAISLSLKAEQDKKKEGLIHPIWTVEIDAIKENLALLEEHRLEKEQNLRKASSNCLQSTSELETLQQEYEQLKLDLIIAQEELIKAKQEYSVHKKNTIESIFYWLSVVTGGLFKSDLYTRERTIDRLTKKANELIAFSNEKNVSINERNNKIKTQEEIINTEKTQLATIDKAIEKAKEELISLESYARKTMDKIRKKCNNPLSFLKKTPVLHSVKRFIQHPTASNLNKLLEKMKKDSHYLKNENSKKLIILVGHVYAAVENMHNLCEVKLNLKQQEIENGLLFAESDQKKVHQELIDDIETDLLFLQDQYQQVCSKDLNEAYFKLAYEKADMSESLFLKDALTRQNEITQICHELKEIERQYDELMATIQNPDSVEGMEQIELIDVNFTKQAEQYHLLQEKRAKIDKEINSYTKKQQDKIKRCFTNITNLELDIIGNITFINHIESKIQQIKIGETAELKEIQEKINAKEEEINATKRQEQAIVIEEYSILKKIEAKKFLAIPELSAVADACVRLKKDPTNDNVNALIATVKTNIHNKSNPLFLEEIKKIGAIYGAVSDAVLLAQQQAPTPEQMRLIIISECRRYIHQHSAKAITAATNKIWENASIFFKTDPSKVSSPISDLSVIKALKAVLKNNTKKPNSIEIIKEFLKYSIINETTEIYRLVKKASEIHPQIRLAYAATQEVKHDTTAFKERFDEQRKTDLSQPIDNSSTDNGLASDLAKIK